MVRRYSADVLYNDQWFLYTPMFEESGAWSAFLLQHGPHRQGLGGAATYLLSSLSVFTIQWENLMIAGVVIMSGTLSLALYKRLHGRWNAPAAVAPLLIMNPSQIGTVVTVPNLSHSVLPVFLLLALANCWICERKWVRYLLSSFIASISLFTGFGVFVYIGFTLLIALDRSSSLNSKYDRLLKGVGIAQLAFALLLFASDYVWDPANPAMKFPHSPAIDYVIFVDYMYGRMLYIEKSFRPYLGFLILVLVLLAGWTALVRASRKGSDPVFSVCFLLVTVGLGFAFGCSIGRVSLGVGTGGGSRYQSLILPSVLAVFFLLGSGVLRKYLGAPAIIAFFVFAVGSYLSNSVYAHDYAMLKHQGKLRWIEAYESSGDPLKAAEESGVAIFPEMHLIRERIEILKERNWGLKSDSN